MIRVAIGRADVGRVAVCDAQPQAPPRDRWHAFAPDLGGAPEDRAGDAIRWLIVCRRQPLRAPARDLRAELSVVTAVAVGVADRVGERVQVDAQAAMPS